MRVWEFEENSVWIVCGELEYFFKRLSIVHLIKTDTNWTGVKRYCMKVHLSKCCVRVHLRGKSKLLKLQLVLVVKIVFTGIRQLQSYVVFIKYWWFLRLFVVRVAGEGGRLLSCTSWWTENLVC